MGMGSGVGIEAAAPGVMGGVAGVAGGVAAGGGAGLVCAKGTGVTGLFGWAGMGCCTGRCALETGCRFACHENHVTVAIFISTINAIHTHVGAVLRLRGGLSGVIWLGALLDGGAWRCAKSCSILLIKLISASPTLFHPSRQPL
uniref:Uncharacterized protein n=1 Tax=mine drainage metagenome TaxID=410659 RepID=E6QTV9_9ZZZZ